MARSPVMEVALTMLLVATAPTFTTAATVPYAAGKDILPPAQLVPEIAAGQASYDALCAPAVVAARRAERNPRMSERMPNLDSFCEPVAGRPKQLSCDPSYFVLGIMKSGTSSFYYYANHHPNIYVRSRENHRWEWPISAEIPKNDKSVYGLDGLSANGTFKYIGEHGPTTMVSTPWNCNPNRGPGKSQIKWCGNKDFSVDFIPKLMIEAYDSKGFQPQFVVVLREPGNRAFSNYLHFYFYACPELKGQEHAHGKCFDKVVRPMLEKFKTCVGDKQHDLDTLVRCAFEPKSHIHYGRRLVTWSLYSIHLAHWMRFFPGARFCLVDEEEWESVEEGMRSFERCLGLQHATGYPEEHFNLAKIQADGVLPDTAAFLEAEFAPYNRQLAYLNPDACEFSWVRRAFGVK